MKLHINDVSLKETFKVIDTLIPLIPNSKVIVFDALMGAGKTTLIKGLCHALGVEDQVNSPTYSLVNEYKTNENKVIYHFDFYRINDLEEAFDMGAEEYFYSGNLCLVEWADKIREILPDRYLKVAIAYAGEKRNYSIEQF